jgi:hypothetical protein
MMCEWCGAMPACHTHHVFMGPNRAKSEHWGMVIKICYDCHALVHADYLERVRMCRVYQRKFETLYDRETFMREFGRNYL